MTDFANNQRECIILRPPRNWHFNIKKQTKKISRKQNPTYRRSWWLAKGMPLYTLPVAPKSGGCQDCGVYNNNYRLYFLGVATPLAKQQRRHEQELLALLLRHRHFACVAGTSRNLWPSQREQTLNQSLQKSATPKSARLQHLLHFSPKKMIAPPNPQFPKYSGAKNYGCAQHKLSPVHITTCPQKT